MKINKLNLSLILMAFMAVVMLPTAFAAVTGCGPTGSTYNDTGVITNVSAGNVCINETDYDVDPTATNKCGTWSAMTAGACTTGNLYVGFAGDGTENCTATGAVAGVGTGVVSVGYRVTTTVNDSSVVPYLSATGGTAAYSSCTNLYTRNGTSGYCDGAGGQAVGTLHVADGKVCVAGANAAPNGSLKCGVWSECVAMATTAPEHNVGYAATGTACSATAWTATSPATVQTAANGQAWRNTENVDTCGVYGYVSVYDKGDVKNIVVDGIGVSGAAVVEWLDLFVLLVVLGFMIGIFVKLGSMFK